MEIYIVPTSHIRLRISKNIKVLDIWKKLYTLEEFSLKPLKADTSELFFWEKDTRWKIESSWLRIIFEKQDEVREIQIQARNAPREKLEVSKIIIENIGIKLSDLIYSILALSIDNKEVLNINGIRVELKNDWITLKEVQKQWIEY